MSQVKTPLPAQHSQVSCRPEAKTKVFLSVEPMSFPLSVLLPLDRAAAAAEVWLSFDSLPVHQLLALMGTGDCQATPASQLGSKEKPPQTSDR